MKFVVLFLLATSLQLGARTSAQTYISLSLKQVPLETVLNDIKKQSGYSIFYADDILKKSVPVTIDVRNAPIDQVLNIVFKGQPLTYEIIGRNQVVIKEKEVPKKEAPRLPTEQAPPQYVDIKGRVVDKNGFPIEGVTITLQLGGTSIKTSTGADGNFTIRSEKDSGLLVFSHVSYQTQSLRISKGNRSSSLNIVLKDIAAELDDVVIIGYGQVKRKDVTGAVSKVDMKDVEKAPVSSFEEALAGRVAGVQVSSGDGQPGAASNIVIRGNNSLTQDNSPLYVIDGFPIENPANNVINPADIESIDVLKDASATAIYGARGANGVIIITTKKGKGTTALSYDGFFGYNSAIKKLDVLSPYEFVKLQHEAFGVQADSVYFKNASLEDYRNLPAINWLDQIFQSAPFQNHTLAIRGGNANGTNYSVSGSIVDQKGLLINSGFKRYQGRAILNQRINEKLQTGVNINYARTQSYGSIVSQYGSTDYQFAIVPAAIGYRPIGGAFSPGANIDELNDDLIGSDLDNSVSTASDYRYNPVSSLQNALNERILSDVIVNGFLQYKITKDLTLKISGGVNNSNNTNNIFNGSNTRSGDIRTPQGVNGPNGTVFNSQTNNFLTENTLNYTRQLSKNHNLNALVGFTYQGNNYSAFGYTANQVPNENLGISGIDEGLPGAIRSSKSSNRLASFLGRVNYNYKSIYYLTVSYRADASSKFAPENRWSYFPSLGLSWRMSREKFFQKLGFISEAKIRGSYGRTGNNRVADFAYLSTLTLPIAANYSFANSYYNGAVLATLGNRNLKWETTDQFDAGLDIEFFKGRFSVAVDYYDKRTSNLLLNANLPGSTGFTNAFQNIGKVQNKGLEITLSTININRKDFSWSSSFNISFNKNKVLALVGDQESILSYTPWALNQFSTAPSYIAKIGQPIAQMYGYVFDGLYQYSDFDITTSGAYVLKSNVPNNGTNRSSIQPGFAKYKDLNGDGVVNSQDQTTIGRAYPLHYGGFSNNLRYKNFDLNLFFQWSYGNDVINATRYVFEGSPKYNQNMLASYANRWTPDNQNTDIPAVNGGGNRIYSSRVIEDGSYLRLKTLQLGYTVKGKALTKIGAKSLRVYVSGQNLITWTKYTGQDPEVSTYTGALTPGFDYSAYPRTRTCTVGVNLSL